MAPSFRDRAGEQALGQGHHDPEQGLAPPGLPGGTAEIPRNFLLVAQALAEGMLLLTSDARVARYPGPIRAV